MLNAKEARKSVDDFNYKKEKQSIVNICCLFGGIPIRIKEAAGEGSSRIFHNDIIIESNMEKDEYDKHIRELEDLGFEVEFSMGSGVRSGKYCLEISW